MANYVLALYFAGRGVVHLLDNNNMLWWDIVMVIFNIILALI
jgi:uncharacterized membrane protein